MLNNARKQRLMREALGNEDGEMSTAQVTYGTIAVFVLILFAATALSGRHQDDRKIVAASVTDRYVASIYDDSMMLKKQEPAGQAQQQGAASTKEPEGNVQDLTY